MRAHILDEQSRIINTVMVESVTDGMISADIGGGIGDLVVDGAIVAAPKPEQTADEYNAPILAMLALLDAKSIRPLREGDAERVADLEQQASALRAKLRKD